MKDDVTALKLALYALADAVDFAATAVEQHAYEWNTTEELATAKKKVEQARKWLETVGEIAND